MKNLLVIGVIGVLLLGTFSGAYAVATITGADIVDKSITIVDLASDSVDGAKIKNLSIKTGDLGDATVTSGKIKDATIQKHDLAPGILPAGATNILHGSCELPNASIIEAQSSLRLTCGERIPGLRAGDHVVASLNDGSFFGIELVMYDVSTDCDCDPDEDATIAFDIYNLSDKDTEFPGSATFNFVAWR
jgi:hypothetical protein